MITFIEILKGLDAGARFEIKNNMTIGRSNADIVINDSRVSARHAQIQIDEQGLFVLIDLDSRNGLVVNGLRTKKVTLIQGVKFNIGRVLFQVAEIKQSNSLPTLGPLHDWREAMQVSLNESHTKDKTKNINLEVFNPSIKLLFKSGVQANEEIILGYGPRKAGLDCLDIELLDSKAPKEAFELHPVFGEVEFRNNAPSIVLINNEPILKKILQAGDLVSIGDTQIKISFL